MNLIPWLIWIFPFIGAVFVIPAARISSKLRDIVAVSFPFLSVLMALLLIPDLLNGTSVDERVPWISIPGVEGIEMGMLVDPLSIILVNVVAIISFLIIVYSIKYMKDDPGLSRFWFLMNVFIGSMLLLVLSDNLIAFYIGWKIVGLCSWGLIGYYHRDEKEYWIGGPPPTSYQKPSGAGLKAMITTGIGDYSLLAGIILIYLYSGSVNYTTIFETTSIWMGEMAQTPGIIMLTAILILGGPIAKSAQFPLHEWLPEAMAGPAPVSALIHAATMVKAGVYLVARLFPIFYYGYWISNFSEAQVFFLLAAGIGAFSAFLAGTQGLVALELKKALAYSTMSQIGYMMLGLGVAGLSPNALIIGFTAALFHLISHAIFKAALFLGAGSVIHSADSIYMSKLNITRKIMPRTWLFMWIGALSLSGVPPLSGFWSKDGILLSTLEANALWLFALALITVSITSFYSIRIMGLVFHKGGSKSNPEKKVVNHKENDEGHHVGEPSYIMWLPYGILAMLTVALGVVGPWFSGFLEHTFGSYFESTLHLTTVHVAGGVNPIVHDFLPFISVGMILLGGYPAYQLYIKKKLNPVKIVSKYRGLRFLYQFLWNRWYLDALYNKIFVDGTLKMRSPTIRYVENPMDRLLNEKVPRFFYWLRGPTLRYVENPMDRLINQRVPGLWIIFANIGRKFDSVIIDGVANGIAAAGQLISRISRTMQRGVMGEYVFAYVVGAILLILYIFFITFLR